MGMLKPLSTVAIAMACVVATAAEGTKEPPPTWPWPGPTPPEIRDALIKMRNGTLPAGQDLKKIEAASPDRAPATPAKLRRVLCWGRLWRHPCNAFTEETVKILGRKTKAFEVVAGDEPRFLLPESLKGFDALFLNGLHDPQPFLPLDWKTLPPGELDAARKQSLLDFVAKDGKGLADIEGPIAALQDWEEFGQMMGAFYNGHCRGEHVYRVESGTGILPFFPDGLEADPTTYPAVVRCRPRP